MNSTTAKLILGLASASILYSFNEITANLANNGSKTSSNASPVVKTRNVTLIEGLNYTSEYQNKINDTKVRLNKYENGVELDVIKQDAQSEIEVEKVSEKSLKTRSDEVRVKVTERVPVKLTMKQGLIMNQVLSTYGLSDIKNELCKNHTEEFKAALRAFEPWALKMFDSSSKLMSGILNGNLAEFGAYWPCLYIYGNTRFGPVRGRHCGFRITPSDKLLQTILSYRNVSEKRFKSLKHHVLDGTRLIWSVCVPDSCTHEDVFPHYNKTMTEVAQGLEFTLSLKKEDCMSLEDYPSVTAGDYFYMLSNPLVNSESPTSPIAREDVFPHYNKTMTEVAQGLEFTLSLKKEDCMSLEDYPSVTAGDYLYMTFVATIVSVVIVCSLINFYHKEPTNTFVDLFSALKNGKLLFATNDNTTELGCLHGIRFLSMLYIVIGHRYQHNFGNPLANSMELVEWVQQYFSTTVFGGTTSVDTFLLVGATLVSYHFFHIVYKTDQFSLFQFYLYRNLRMLMPLILTVTTYVTIMKHFGSGTLFYDFYKGWKRPCQAFWWSTLLHVQAFVNPEFLCVPQTWYLGVDMFWYYVSPIVLVPLWKNEVLGYISFIVVYILSIAINFYLAWKWEFDGGIPVTARFVQTDFFAHHYIQPYCRGSPYVLGLALGYALYKTKGQEFKMNLFAKIAGWTLSFGMLIGTVLISHMFHVETYHYDKLFSSMFLSCHRSIWTFALIWIIWCCEKDCGGIVNTILSHGSMKILGRLGYNIFLLHYLFQGVMQSSQKVPGYFSDFMSIYMAVSDMVLSSGLSVIVTLCFEYPFVRMVGVFLKSDRSKKKVKPTTERIRRLEETK